MKVLTVIGNRPQFIKAAAVSPLLREEHQEYLVHTGQHYDDQLSAVFFAELGLPAPDEQLGIGGGSSTSQTSRMLAALEPVLERSKPDVVLVYGDTNSTLAGALAGAQGRVPVVHVEAGMRSFDRTMPEELNRVLVDHASSLLLCSTEVAMAHLDAEAVSGTSELVGDVMVDIALAAQPRARAHDDLVRRRGLEPGGYVLATAHRAGNVDDPQRLERLVALLSSLPLAVVLPVHPRTEARLRSADDKVNLGSCDEHAATIDLTRSKHEHFKHTRRPTCASAFGVNHPLENFLDLRRAAVKIACLSNPS